MFKYLRDPALALWASLATLLALVLVAAHAAGSSPRTSTGQQPALPVPAAQTSAAQSVLTELESQVGLMFSSSGNDQIAQVSGQLVALASRARAQRQAEGAHQGDPLLDSLTSLSRDLAAWGRASDPAAQFSLRGHALNDLQAAVSAAAGTPVPALVHHDQSSIHLQETP